MSRKTTDHTEEIIASFPPLELPAFDEPTPEEIERRRQLIERTRKRRAEIGPINISTDDLLHEARKEER